MKIEQLLSKQLLAEALNVDKLDAQFTKLALRVVKDVVEGKVELTADQKKRLLADFKEWSGGFDPSECPWKGDDEDEMSILQYIEHALPTDLPKQAAIDYLESLT